MTQSRREDRPTPTGKRTKATGSAGGSGRTGWKRAVVGTLKWGSLAALVLLVLGAAGVALAYVRTDIPKPNEMVDTQVSIVYYADGKTELDRIAVADGNRESVALSKVPKAVQQAHLAAEDRTFYDNNGISLSGILRAVKTSVTGQAQVGGSTITQQYVKNYFLSQDRTLTRKAKEILLAVKIDGQYSKDQILEDYLNTIYYGRGAYGIQSAAKAYFNKDVSKLTVPEGAVLASVINAPSLYDPSRGDKAVANLEKRYGYVLDGMVEQGWLTADERATYTALPKIRAFKGNAFSSGSTGYITAAVKNELLSTGLTDADIDKGGLRITTTIDKTSQAAAVKAMKDNLPDKVTGGLVAMVPGDGAIRAMYGGADYGKSQLNTATQAILQGASNFKPFAVLAAVREGISTKTKFDGDSPQDISGQTGDELRRAVLRPGRHDPDDRPLDQHGLRQPQRPGHPGRGPVRPRSTPASRSTPPVSTPASTNVLGSASPHVIDMATAYSTIAGQGERVKAYLITKVTSTTSSYVYDVQPTPKRVVRRRRHRRRHRRDDLHRQGRRHGDQAPAARPPGRGQDRHLLLRQVDLVHRVRAPADRLGRDVQARRERQPADPDRRRGHQPHRWHDPGRRLLRLHEGRARRRRGPGLPEARRGRRRQGQRPADLDLPPARTDAAALAGPVDHELGPDDDDGAADDD